MACVVLGTRDRFPIRLANVAAYFRRLNRRFADAIVARVQPGTRKRALPARRVRRPQARVTRDFARSLGAGLQLEYAVAGQWTDGRGVLIVRQRLYKSRREPTRIFGFISKIGDLTRNHKCSDSVSAIWYENPRESEYPVLYAN